MKYNELSKWHKDILRYMLTKQHYFNEEIEKQLESASFDLLEDGISLGIKAVKTSEKLENLTVPIEVESYDIDGMDIHGLLFSRNGIIFYLEFYRDDGKKIVEIPKVDSFEIFSFGI